MASNSGVQVQRLDDSDGGLGLLQVVIVRTDAECDNAVRMLRAPMVFTLVLVFLLVAVAHFSDALMCLLSVVLYAMLARHAGEANFTLTFLLIVMEGLQMFLSSLRLLLLQVGAADELVPPEDRQLFTAFAVGAVAAPIVHICSFHYSVKLYQQLRHTINKRTVPHLSLTGLPPDSDGDGAFGAVPNDERIVVPSELLRGAPVNGGTASEGAV